MAYGMRETLGTRFRRVSKQAAEIQEADDAEWAAFVQAYIQGVTDEELDRLIEDAEEAGRVEAILSEQFAQHQKDNKERRERGEPEIQVRETCPPVCVF